MSNLVAPMTMSLVSDSDAQISEILARHLEALRGAFSENTLRAIKSDVTQFYIWCHENGRRSLPASVETISRYVDVMSATYAPATVKRRLASIGHIHRALEEDDVTKSSAVRMAIRKMDRLRCSRQKQAVAFCAEDVDAIIRNSGTKLIDLRDIAMLLTARDLLGRRSEIIALRVDDVIFHPDGSGTITIRQSKTDQTGKGAVMWVSIKAAEALRTWLDLSGVEDGFLFRAVRKGDRIGGALSADDVSRRYKIMAERAGIDPSGISGHSARVGMSQDLCAAGMELTELMLAGRWISPKMPARYAERLQASRGAVAKYHAIK